MRVAHCLRIAIATLLLSAVRLAATESESGLSPELIRRLRESVKLEGAERTIYNSLLKNNIRDLALDHDKLVEHQDLFNVKIDTKGITNQKNSGRCWLFASLNLLRPAVIKKYKLNEFEFSQNYLAFWDKLEKANKFLEVIIALRDRDLLDREVQAFLKDPIGDGGWWYYTVDLLEKYGCVPKEVMPETESSGNTGMMNSLLAEKLRLDASELRDLAAQGGSVPELRRRKEALLPEIYRMLVLNLGVPPTEFTWRYEDKDTLVSSPRSYTPQKFYHDVVGVDLGQYVTLTDHPGVPKFASYKIRLTRNMYDHEDGAFINVPMDTIRAYALKILLADQPVVFAADVGSDNYNGSGVFERGIYDYASVYGTGFIQDKPTRFRYYESTANHMMLFIACDTAGGAVTKWKIENSWGTDRGDAGYWTMYNDWFDDYVFEIIVDRKLLSDDLQRLLKVSPVELPPWDPYFEYYRH